MQTPRSLAMSSWQGKVLANLGEHRLQVKEVEANGQLNKLPSRRWAHGRSSALWWCIGLPSLGRLEKHRQRRRSMPAILGSCIFSGVEAQASPQCEAGRKIAILLGGALWKATLGPWVELGFKWGRRRCQGHCCSFRQGEKPMQGRGLDGVETIYYDGQGGSVATVKLLAVGLSVRAEPPEWFKLLIVGKKRRD